MWDYQAIYEHAVAVGSDCADVFGGSFTGGYFIQQRPEEAASFLMSLQDIPIRNYLEIGTAACGTTRLFSDCLSIENIHLVDNCDHHNSCYKITNLANLRNTGTLRTFWGDSHSPEAADWIAQSNYDLVLIDGDHSVEGAQQDFDVVWPHVVDGGLIAFHDYVTLSNVAKVVDRLAFGGQVRPYSLHVHKPSPMGIFVFRKTEPWRQLL